MRPLLAISAVLLLSTTTLAACGSSDDSTSSASDDSATCTTYPSGSSSDSVKVTGDFGKTDPKATFTTPLEVEADSLQRTIATEGDGEDTAPGDAVSVIVSMFNGRTGEKALSQAATLTVADESTYEAFRAAIECVPTGSRVVTTVAAADVYGEEGYADLDIKATDSLVLVTDVIEVEKPVTAEPWTKDVPEVTFDSDGKPTVTLPKTDPPTDLLLAVLKEGDGDTVESGDSVSVDYQGTNWETGEIFDQSYGSSPATFSTNQVIKGFAAAVVGQKVGARVLVTIPPEYGYGTDETASELANQTLVFVIEIKSIEES